MPRRDYRILDEGQSSHTINVDVSQGGGAAPSTPPASGAGLRHEHNLEGTEWHSTGSSMRAMGIKDVLMSYLPIQKDQGIWAWGPTYNREANLMGDLISGLSIGIMLVPQGMAHAAIANMPPSTGLYAAFIPVIVYAIFGTSRHLAPGSGALVALLIGSSLMKIPGALFDNNAGCSIALMDWSGPSDTKSLHWEAQDTAACGRCVKTCYTLPTKKFAWEQVGPFEESQHFYEQAGFGTEAAQLGAWCVDRCLQDARTQAGFALSLISGLVLMVLGMLNFGYVVNFFSGPVLNGFTCAGGCIIALGQMGTFFGESKKESASACGAMFGEDSWNCETPRAYVTLFSFFYAIPTIRINQTSMSVFTLLLLIFFKKWKAHWGKSNHPRAKTFKIIGDFGALWVVVIATFFTAVSGGHIDHVGSVPNRLPSIAWPNVSGREFGGLLADGCMIALLSFLASVAVASKFAKKFSYEIAPNQELFALGAACFFGGFAGSFPIQGSLSRTAVNAQNGKTQLSSLITACVVGFAVVAITPLVYYLPKSALASIIILATQELLDFSPAEKLYKRKQYNELGVFCAAFVATLILGVLGGLISAMIVSVLMLTFRATRPPVREVARVNGHRVYRGVELSYTTRQENVEIITVEGSLFFANAVYFRDTVKALVAGRAEATVIFDFGSVSDIDSTAIDVISEVVGEITAQGKRVCFSQMRQRVREAFYLGGLVSAVGQNNFYIDLHDAVVEASNKSRHRMVSAIRAQLGGGAGEAGAHSYGQGLETEWEDKKQEEQEEAATLLQAHIRGWQVRRTQSFARR